ncbi:MAG: recombination protein O N-terminal domain-containing protein [Candidatus Paceibacterota bacterium]|jgi:recombinational DNA repair protein (RecF pathway)
MSHDKYTTEAFILREYEQGEHDIVYKVWTREFGIIFAIAKSIRKINAKLRPIIKKNDFIIITLVKGRDIWRLVGAEELFLDLNSNITKSWSFKAKKVISEIIFKFIEEKKTYKKLFDKIKSIFFLDQGVDILEINNFKILIYYLVLVDTGYADASIIGAKDIEEYKSFSVKDFYTHFILNEKEVKKHVLHVLRETML